MDMIERVARVICQPYIHAGDGNADVIWPEYADDAKAVIEAMREPTADMKAAGSDVWERSEQAVAAEWRGMIDAALKD